MPRLARRSKTSDIVVSYSEIDAARQCPHKHALAFREHWAPAEVSDALSKGLMWHKVMELHYNLIKERASDRARLRAVADFLLNQARYKPEIADLIAWMYDNHCAVYGVDKQWEIISVEEAGMQRLPKRDGTPSRFLLRRRTDLVVRDKSLIKPRIVIVDHKSGKDLPSEKELDLDDQMGLYEWGLNEAGFDVFQIVYSSIRTYRHKEPRAAEEMVARKRLYRTPKELETIAIEAFITMERAYSVASKDAERHTNPDTCRWRCPFTQPCLGARKGMNETTFLKAEGFRKLTPEAYWAMRGYAPEERERGPKDADNQEK